MTKSSAFFLFLTYFAVSSVNSQPDVWLNVARDVSVDFTNFLANFPVPFLDSFQVPPSLVGPNIVIPSSSAATAPVPRITIVNGQPVLTFEPASSRPIPSSPTPSPALLPNIRDHWDALDHPLLSIYRILNGPNPGLSAPLRNLPNLPGQIITIPSPSPSSSLAWPSPPHHHHGPCHSGCGCKGPACKPERVRIVVVDDCNDKKKKSSESCSSESKSDEVDVVVPRTGRKTIRYTVN
jgi:hypothetical protein